MIINFTEKDGKIGVFVNENKDNVRLAKSGKSYSFLITETASIMLVRGDKTKNITGKQFVKLFFK